jgi:hypothetical protein
VAFYDVDARKIGFTGFAIDAPLHQTIVCEAPDEQDTYFNADLVAVYQLFGSGTELPIPVESDYSVVDATLPDVVGDETTYTIGWTDWTGSHIPDLTAAR